MNLKQNLLAIIISVFSVGAFASVPAILSVNEVSFPISTHADWGGQVYYDCRSVEAATRDFLTSMGGVNIHVSCTGGLDHGFVQPAYVRALYTSALSAKSSDATHQANYRMVHLEGRDSNSGVNKGHSCHLMHDIFKYNADMFEITDVEARFHCGSSFSRSYSIRLNSLGL